MLWAPSSTVICVSAIWNPLRWQSLSHSIAAAGLHPLLEQMVIMSFDNQPFAAPSTPFPLTPRSSASEPTHEKQYDQDDQDDAEDTDATVTVAVSVTAEAAAESAQQEDDKDDNEYEANRHDLSQVATARVLSYSARHSPRAGEANRPDFPAGVREGRRGDSA